MKDLILHQIYKTASIVEDAIHYGAPLDFTNKKELLCLSQKASAFDKHTLLHFFIKQEFIDYYNHFFIQMADYVHDETIELEFLEEQFSHYEVSIDFLQIKYDENDYPITTNTQITHWYKRNKKKFIHLSEKICDEVFFILFSNRKLLHKFNKNISSDFSKFLFNDQQLTSKGTLKRKPIPKWLQDAIFHRDKGRCSFCWSDLSKLNNLDAKYNFDHIIPLDLFGVNDPTNVQLVCKDCNLKKLNRNTDVGTKYQQWFL